MLTRKHFKAAAEKNREVIEAFSSSKGHSQEQKIIILKALYRMVRAQASWMSSENPNFNWDKFIRASGLTSENIFIGGDL